MHAATAESEAMLRALEDSLPAMVAEIETLVSCESPSSDLSAVARSAEVLAGIGAARLGVAPEMVVVDGCTHLLWRFGESERRVLLLGHHDTVWPIGSLQTHPAVTRDGVLRGPGCLDMKAGVVMGIHALAARRAAGGSLDGVSLLITGDEELGAKSSRELITREARHSAAVLVLEAATPGGAVKIARKGRARYEITIEGRAAHAGLEPEAGVNAAVAVAHHLLSTSALASEAAGTSVTPTLLSGGSAANTVPALASYTIDVRAWQLAELERVDAGVRSTDATVVGARVSVSGGIEAAPLEQAMSAQLFALAREVAGAVGLGELEGVAVGGGSDGNLTASLGIPTLDGLGATGDGLHADHEHVIVADLPRRTGLLCALVGRILGTETRR
jgi:glutamate carboxypeptidase